VQPASEPISKSKQLNRKALTNGNKTVVAVISAAEGLATASSTRTGSDDGDGSASDTNEGGNILDDDFQATKDSSNGKASGKTVTVAALNRSGVTLRSGQVVCGGTGR
jgi:hypothetical protein